MQVVILCGGSGTRLREETEFRPKPMIHIGGKPMLWHIMKIYSHYGFHDFILALGYKQEIIREYFIHYPELNCDLTVNTGPYRGDPSYRTRSENWNVTLVDTGEQTFKGGRLKRIEKYIQGDTFCCTYGDGVADIRLDSLLEFHLRHGKIATVTGIHPHPKFGEIAHRNGCVLSYSEKAPDADCLVNGGFMVFNRGIFDYLSEDDWCDLERGPFELLVNKGELMMYQHKGWWGCMDTIRETDELRNLWDSGKAPWKI